MTDSLRPAPSLSLLDHLGQVPDPRVKRAQHHDFLDILAIALCAVIARADHWTEVVQFGQVKVDWFGRFLKLRSSIPSMTPLP